MQDPAASQALDEPSGRRFRRWMYLVPLGAFGLLVAAFAVGLTLDPSRLPSMLIGKQVPEFSLPPVNGRDRGLSSADLKGQPSLVNVWASWCTECRAEHPFLMELEASGIVPVHGLNYKDKPADARRWLDDLGDPYTLIGADLDGRVAIEWGVYGVPETFVIDPEGQVVHRHVGALSWPEFENEVRPLLVEMTEPGS